ncbi:MDR family MFS transporter [Janibacter indicus]|uniref:Drug resistance transporter, EmrB/QacA subfamily n=1 Tax=Janibacter indicus TaxID=857417 RepID=A0A1W2ANT4_9MICO|nr:MDR family MFS transporter [Janibacter indicus]SMC62367.1 drug resistance transporter, EmrB/QacA subfamily [Janibacter indicus]
MSSTTASAPYTLSTENKRVFAGLMLGMLVASVSQTIVGPALPRIVSELGGMDHYSWVATAAMLVSAVTVPIVGKFSDLYGRRGFYLGGIVVFMIGSLIAGFSQSFWMLVAGRAVQGLGMGTLMPLSQTIIGDIIPPRQRGKYQGLMGAVFGVTSVAGPLLGGVITDHLGWRWLFFVSLPIGLIALFFIARFLHVPHTPRKAPIDYLGITTLSTGLVALLLAVSFGGSSWAWGSTESISLFVLSVVALTAFVLVERKAVEPVLPLRLFANRAISLSLVSAFGVAIVMFGAIIYIPVFAQGVIGVNATNSGLILMPLMLGFIICGILTGMLITRTGKYLPFMLTGIAVMSVGVFLLTRLDHTATSLQLTEAMVVLGIGLGMAMQQYTLVVQNAVSRSDMGVATASTQFFRNVGSTVGIAIFGAVMSSGLQEKIASHLPGGMPAQAGGHMDAGAVLDPSALAKLPPAVADAVRWGLADKLTDAFALGLPILAVVFVATLFIPNTPLRETNDDHPVGDAGQQVLDASASESGESDHRTTREGGAAASQSTEPGASVDSDLAGARRG